MEAIDRNGRMTAAADAFADLPTDEARAAIVAALEGAGFVLDRQPVAQSVRVHERCDTPVEYIVTQQWFVRVLDFKEDFLAAGEQVQWHPPHMKARYTQWVENLSWDWCISRQRYFGVPFPLWYCDACGAIITADPDHLPIDPNDTPPPRPCPHCGGDHFTPEPDVMDTWATSSMSPQIVGRWLSDPTLYAQVYPFALRPQAHEIIRTWAFYTIVMSHFHFGALPWRHVAISGWGLAPEGTAKLSKSRGGGPVAPLEMIEQYSADAVRYWAASTGLGKDAVINEEKIQAGAKLVTKLWNVARFSGRFLAGWQPPVASPPLTPADRWILARTQQLIGRVTDLFRDYDYATAKSEIEVFFWNDLADNYLEMAKKRLYDEDAAATGARFVLHRALLATIKLLAPLLPYVTERIYQGLFADHEGVASLHRASWPQVDETLRDATAVALGETLVEIATAVRRYKSERNLSLGADVARLHLATADEMLAHALATAVADLSSITRAQEIVINEPPGAAVETLVENGRVRIGVEHNE